VFNSPEALPLDRSSLIACSSKYGRTFVAVGTRK